MTQSISIVLLVAFAANLSAQAPETAESRARRIENELRKPVRVTGITDSTFSIADRAKYWHVPGVSIAVVDDFRIVYARGFGVTEFGGTTPVDTTTLFLAGSISKPVFATGALKLVEQGKLALDEDVNAKLKSWHLPDSKFTQNEKVTLRRLLTHSAGLTVWGFPGYASDKPVPTVPQLLDGAAPANTPAVRNDTTPGARWMYSGGGMTIAQLLASDVTGESFPALMKRLVLDPADMRRSTYENPLPQARHREAASGHERIDTPVPGRFHTYPEMAAAGLWTTAPELARWALAITRAYNSAPNGILSPAMAQQMVKKLVPTGPQGGNGFYGLGVAVASEGDSIAFSHNGRDEGFVANAIMFPRLGRGLFVLTSGVSGAFMSEVMNAFGRIYGYGAQARVERTMATVDTAALRSMVGSYESIGPADTLRYDVTLVDGSLRVFNQLGKRAFQLYPVSAASFLDANNGQTFVFERDSTAAGHPVRAMRLAPGPNARRAVKLRQAPERTFR